MVADGDLALGTRAERISQLAASGIYHGGIHSNSSDAP